MFVPILLNDIETLTYINFGYQNLGINKASSTFFDIQFFSVSVLVLPCLQALEDKVL